MVKQLLRENGIIKKNRVGFVGLSSPTAYLYNFKKYAPNNPWDWNPILESPQGLSVLYDEVLFLHKALCPTSMISFPFVNFVEEEVNSSTLDKILKILFFKQNDETLLHFVDRETPFDFSSYNSHIDLIFGKYPSFDNPIDNHTHKFYLNNIEMHGDSQNPQLILYDLMILEELQKDYPHTEFELITNKFTTTRLMYQPNELKESRLAQDFLINGSSNIPYIPVLQNELGPDLHYIERLREANSLIDFREKLLREVNKEDTERIDVEKIAYDMRQEFDKYESDDLYLKTSNLRKTYSVSSLILTTFSFLLPPPLGEVITTLNDTSNIAKALDENNKSKLNWSSFITAINREKRLEDEKKYRS
jgi:hypothetical protein